MHKTITQLFLDGQHFWGSLLGQKHDMCVGLKSSCHYYQMHFPPSIWINCKMCIIKNSRKYLKRNLQIFSLLIIILVKCNKNKKCIVVWRELLLSVYSINGSVKFTFSGYCLFNWLFLLLFLLMFLLFFLILWTLFCNVLLLVVWCSILIDDFIFGLIFYIIIQFFVFFSSLIIILDYFKNL